MEKNFSLFETRVNENVTFAKGMTIHFTSVLNDKMITFSLYVCYNWRPSLTNGYVNNIIDF